MDSDFQPLYGYPHVFVAASTADSDAQGHKRQIRVHYRGPAEALIAAGTASAEMLDPERRHEARIDEDGDEYCGSRLWYQPMDGSARYWRWHLTRTKPAERALRLPGAAAAWERFERQRQAEEERRREELARRPTARPIRSDGWKHGGKAGRITRGEAVEIAYRHLTRQLRACLECYETWLPREPFDPAARIEVLGPCSDDWTPDEDGEKELPPSGRGLSLDRLRRPEPVTSLDREPAGQPAWKILVPSDFGGAMMLGSTRTVTIDAVTGEILSDWPEGE
ncbi:MAG: PepSY domain-containing protein [Steroidobacteraceae bacterium]